MGRLNSNSNNSKLGQQYNNVKDFTSQNRTLGLKSLGKVLGPNLIARFGGELASCVSSWDKKFHVVHSVQCNTTAAALSVVGSGAQLAASISGTAELRRRATQAWKQV